HSTVWRGDATGRDAQLSPDDAAFHPIAIAGTLVWVQVAREALVSAASAAPGTTTRMGTGTSALSTLRGTLEARDLATGRQWQVSPSADVAGVATGGSLVLWRSASETHVYDLRTKADGNVDAQVRGAGVAGVGAGAVVWAQPGSSTLYVADAQ
ncbi:MAG: hypothetical protein IVW57_17325, partial [Ktedonobacterales bacterium]|nr:hypothetical protein [Ktedonobacterales bacterium]